MITEPLPLTPADAAAIRARGLCPTCGAIMQPAGKRSFVCPVARTEAKRISPEVRQQLQRAAEERVSGLPF